MQQAHAVSHLLRHLFLKGAWIGQPDFHDVAVAAGAAIAVAHCTAAILGIDRAGGHQHKQQGCHRAKEMSVCHLFHCFIGYFPAKLGNLNDHYNNSSVFSMNDNPRYSCCNEGGHE